LNKSLVLTGMMGVGKSTIGRLIAKRLKIKFIDVDKVIEKKEKKTIKRIFEDNGEKYFRKLEEKTTLKILKNNRSVIALGGGAFINKEIRQKVLTSCLSVWLKVDLDKLIKRYNKNDRRPLLDKKKLSTDVKRIYHSRKKIYSLANFKINCDNIDKIKIVQKILNFYAN
jgi:shikimate kinase